MTARLRRLALVLALAPGLGCAMSHHARDAPLGDPSTPALRADSVTTGEVATEPGEHDLGNSDWARPVVTREGLQNREVNADDTKRTVLLSVRVQGGAGVDVVDMTWSPAGAPRCQGGHPALAVLLDLDAPRNHAFADDKQVHWERPVVVRGERVLTGRFDEDRPLLHAPSVVDVYLVEHDAAGARETCVRVPVTGPEVTYVSDKKWSLGARLEWRRAMAFSSSSTMMVGLSFARWVGPVRLGLEGVIGGTDTPSKDGPGGTAWCFWSTGPDCDGVDVGGFSLEASGLAQRWNRWAIGWSVAYEGLFAAVHRLDPAGGPTLNRSASAGGPRLGLRLLRVTPHVMGITRSSPTSAWGFEVFASAAQEWSGAASGSPVTFGVSLLGF